MSLDVIVDRWEDRARSGSWTEFAAAPGRHTDVSGFGLDVAHVGEAVQHRQLDPEGYVVVTAWL